MFPMVAAERADLGPAGGPGDSGGPVFEPPPPGDRGVIAKGIIHGGDPATAVPCTVGETARTGCAWRYFYADVTQTLAYYGAAITEGEPPILLGRSRGCVHPGAQVRESSRASTRAESTARVCDHGTGLGAPSTMDRKASSVPR